MFFDVLWWEGSAMLEASTAQEKVTLLFIIPTFLILKMHLKNDACSARYLLQGSVESRDLASNPKIPLN